MTAEQIVRSILERALADGLVAPMQISEEPDFDAHPWSRTDAELRGCATVLREAFGKRASIPAPHVST
jgi:hypothetical protein